MAFLSDVLRPYLKEVTESCTPADQARWLSILEKNKRYEPKSEQVVKFERQQCERAAEMFRDQGNARFKKQEFDEASNLYTKSIASAKEGPLASLAYSNRSAALFQMKFYEDCIKDIDRALSCGYPKNQQLYNLHLRKARCLKFLKKDHAGSLNDAMEAMNFHNKSDIQTHSELLALKMTEPEPVFNEITVPEPNIDWQLPALSYGQNPEVPSFSKAASLEYDKKFGRHLIANRNITTGDAVIVDECFASYVFPNVHCDVCNFCYKYCFSLIPCTKCGDSLYCSDKCRGDDWNHSHGVICGKHTPFTDEVKDFELDEISEPLMVLIPLIAHIGLDNIKQIVLENKPMPSLLGDPRTRGFQNGKFNEVTLEALLSLEDMFDSTSSYVKLHVTKMILKHCIITYKISLAQLLPVAAILLKLFMVIKCNMLGNYCVNVRHKNPSPIRGMYLGNALNLASSLVNHSCDPNMFQVSYGRNTVFRAIRPISKGEQLTYCCSKLAVDTSYEERQSILFEKYQFQCICLACAGRYPTMDRLPPHPPKDKLHQMLVAAGIVDSKATNILMYFCSVDIPPTKRMLTKLIALLQSYKASNLKLTQWYYKLQNCILNYYQTEGNCLFYGASKQILNGRMDFDMTDYFSSVEN